MDYTQSDAYVVDGVTGYRMHQSTAPVTTEVSADDVNGLTWEVLELIKSANIAPLAFDKNVPGTYSQLRNAINVLFQKRSVNVLAFFANGVSGAFVDPTGVIASHLGIQAAINYVAATGGGTVEFPPGALFKMLAGLSVDTDKVGLNGNGVRLDFSGMTVGSAFTLTNSNASVSLRAMNSTAHPIKNLNCQGPGVGVTAVTAVTLSDTSGLNTLAGVRVQNCSFLNFAKDVYFGIGAFCNTFFQCQFTAVGAPTTYSVTNPSTTNSGERNEFISCMWFNRQYVLDQSNTSASTYYTNCSIDYCGRAMTITGGNVIMTDCHIEDNADTDWMYSVEGAWVYSTLTINGGDIVLSAAKTVKAPFNSASTITNGGIRLNNVTVTQGNNWTTRLIDGTGLGFANNTLFVNRVPVISYAQSSLAYGGFESANIAADWALSGTTPPSRSTVQKYAGTYSLLFAGGAANPAPQALASTPIKPGQNATAEWQLLLPNLNGTGGTFFVTLRILDKAGNQLQNYDFLMLSASANVAGWVKGLHRMGVCAPAGAATATLNVGFFGVTSGAPTAYLDEVVFTVQ